MESPYLFFLTTHFIILLVSIFLEFGYVILNCALSVIKDEEPDFKCLFSDNRYDDYEEVDKLGVVAIVCALVYSLVWPLADFVLIIYAILMGARWITRTNKKLDKLNDFEKDA